MNLRDQLTSVQNQLAEEKSKVVDRNAELIAQLEAREAELLQAIMVEEDTLKSAQIQQQAAAIDVSAVEIPRQYDFSVDFNDIFGTSILNDEIQKILDAQREQLISYYMTIQEERDNTIREQRKEIDAVNEENKALRVGNGQTELERDDFKKRFENAGTLIEELQQEVDRLKEREMELIEAANKAPLLYPHKVIDITPSNLDAGEAIREQRAKELAAKPKVWGLQWADELKKTEYKAVGEDGAELIIKRLEVGKYNVQEGPRPEQVVTEVVVEDVQDSVAPEVPFLELPSIEVPTVSAPVAEGPSSDSGQGEVTRKEFEELKHEVTMLAVELKARAILPFNWEAAS